MLRRFICRLDCDSILKVVVYNSSRSTRKKIVRASPLGRCPRPEGPRAAEQASKCSSFFFFFFFFQRPLYKKCSDLQKSRFSSPILNMLKSSVGYENLHSTSSSHDKQTLKISKNVTFHQGAGKRPAAQEKK